MAKRFYNLERETKALLKRWGETRGTLPDAAGIARVNEYILRKKGLGELVGGIAKRGADFIPTQSQYLRNTSPSLTLGAAWSTCGWFKRNTTNATHFLFNYGSGKKCYTNNSNQIIFENIGGNSIQTGSSNTNWNFYTVIADSTSNRVSLNNGSFATGGTTGAYTNPTKILIASDTAETSGFFNGMQDGVFHWSRTLSASEITYLYNSGLGRSYLEILAYQPSLLISMVSYWPLNEGSGIRRDWHGANHLSAVNNPLNTTGIVEELF